MDRDFKGVWIDRAIWLDRSLGWSEKLLLVEIDSLATLGKCFATNEYFGLFFNLSKDRISKIISELVKKGYIETELIYFQGTKNVKKRLITTRGYRRKQLEGIGENNDTPPGENAEDINTSSINPIINTEEEEEPPTPKAPSAPISPRPGLSTALGSEIVEAWRIMPESIPKPYGAAGMELLSDDLRRALEAIRSKRITSVDVLACIENYRATANGEAGETWVKIWLGLAKFFETDFWQNFLPTRWPDAVKKLQEKPKPDIDWTELEKEAKRLEGLK